LFKFKIAIELEKILISELKKKFFEGIKKVSVNSKNLSFFRKEFTKFIVIPVLGEISLVFILFFSLSSK